MIRIALVGDSDIARWPLELLPSIESSDDGIIVAASPIVSGHPGATLEQVLPRVEETIDQLLDPSDSMTTNTTSFIIVCAGENDIGDGIPLARTEAALRSLCNMCTCTTMRTRDSPVRGKSPPLHLFVLGPKFEPWLVDDMEARKSYVRMAQSFGRICRDFEKGGKQHPHVACSIRYIDCLTMFCGASAKQPGAVLGGKAIAQPQYFDSDQLHLSYDGYMIWQAIVEATIRQLLSNVTNA